MDEPHALASEHYRSLIATIAAMHAEVAPLHGLARAPGLINIGQALAKAYWFVGPGQPAGRPHLDEAAEVLDEAYNHHQFGDPQRGRVAAILGFVLTARFSFHGGPPHDRETAVHLLREALSFPDLHPAQAAFLRINLGHLYLSRLGELPMPQVSAAHRTGDAPSGATDLKLAAGCFRAVVEDPNSGAGLVNFAGRLLAMVEALESIFGEFDGRPGGFDITSTMRALAALAELQEEAGRDSAAGFASLPAPMSFFDTDLPAPIASPDRLVATPSVPPPATPDPVAKSNPTLEPLADALAPQAAPEADLDTPASGLIAPA